MYLVTVTSCGAVAQSWGSSLSHLRPSLPFFLLHIHASASAVGISHRQPDHLVSLQPSSSHTSRYLPGSSLFFDDEPPDPSALACDCGVLKPVGLVSGGGVHGYRMGQSTTSSARGGGCCVGCRIRRTSLSLPPATISSLPVLTMTREPSSLAYVAIDRRIAARAGGT